MMLSSKKMKMSKKERIFVLLNMNIKFHISLKMKNLVIVFVLLGFIFSGCRRKPDVGDERQAVIFFLTRSLAASSSKSSATEEEKLIKKIKMFGVDENNNVIRSFDVIENPSLTNGIRYVFSSSVKSLYAIANPSDALVAANPSNVSDLLALTDDFTNAPESPFLMSGRAAVTSYTVNIEMVRSIAKVVVTGEDGFKVQSVTVKNTPTRGFVFAQPSLTIPSSGRVNYPENVNTTLYVAENSRQNQTTLTVKGTVNDKPLEVDVLFTVNQTLVDIVRNTVYSIFISSRNQFLDVNITIRDWDDVEIDRIYFDD